MAVLYVFTVNDPNSAGIYPPSLVSSSYLSNISTSIAPYQISESITSTSQLTTAIFPDETTLNTWLAANTLTDAGLLADLASWKSAHGVSYSSAYYQLSLATGITSGPIFN
jgi:hypothetical protein